MTTDTRLLPDPVDICEDLAQELMRQLDLLNGTKIQEDVSYGQFKILSVVHTKGPVTIGDLGGRVGLAQSTTSEMVARLKKTGMVTKVKGPYDGRMVMVELTDRGRKLIQRRKHRVRQAYRKLFSKLPKTDQMLFANALKQLNEILNRSLEY